MTVLHRILRRNPRAGLSNLIIVLATLGCLAASVWAEPYGYSEVRYPDAWPGLGPSKVASVDQVSVGTTWTFWAYAQGFFSGYYRLSATCQDTTPNGYAYLFTEDAYLNDIAASSDDPDTIFAAGKGGVYKSTDGGQHWTVTVSGLPSADNEATTSNYRADMNSLFSRSLYNDPFDSILWVGTEYGPYWSTNRGSTFVLRAGGMAVADPASQQKPAVYDILGHPTEVKTVWAATIDGVYMTRDNNHWKHLAGLPPGEGSIWATGPVQAVAYHDSMIFAASSKGVFYGRTRPVDPSSQNVNILASWKPLGGLLSFTVDPYKPANADTLWLRPSDSTSLNLALAAGQFVTLIDTVSGIYWSAAVDVDTAGLFTRLTNSAIFYYPTGSTAPSVNYSQLNLSNLIAYGYAQVPGNALFVESANGVLTVWLGGAGVTSYTFTGDVSQRYSASQEVVTTSHDSITVYKIDKRDSDYYLATNLGLYRATDPHGAWTLLTGYIYNNTRNDSVNVDARTVAFGPGGKMFTGGWFGGFLRSDDGEAFTPSNLGMMYRNGNAQQLSEFADQFDKHTPADSTEGIYQKVQDWWGPLPPANSPDDIDGDPHVTILFLDIDDQYHLSTGDGTYINGYYDGHNEYSRLYFINSNQQEMFYLDTEPGWINQGGPAACNQMFNLINWNQDFDEEVWLREGMASFSQFEAGYPLTNSDPISFPMLNSLINWGDANRDIEHLYSFLLVLYLYEHQFPDTLINGQVQHRISEIAVSPYHGVSGLGRLIYEKEYGTSSNSVDYTSTFAQVFSDFVMAGVLDISDSAFYGGKYGFKAVNTHAGAMDLVNWHFDISVPPFYNPVPFWSGRVAQVVDTLFFNNNYPITTILVNGENSNKFNFKLLYSMQPTFTPEMPASDVTVMDIPTDTLTQKGRVNLPPNLQLGNGNVPPNIMRLVIVCTSDSGTASTCYSFSDDTLPPDSLYLAVVQNPVDNSYLDIYSFMNERMFPDGGQIYRVDGLGSTELEGPKVDITGGVASNNNQDTTITLDQNIFFSNPQANDFAYHIAYHLNGINFPDTLHFRGYGEDAAGNTKQSGDMTALVDFVQTQSGAYLSDALSGACVTIAPQALAQNAFVMLCVSPLPPNLTQGQSAARAVSSLGDPSHQPVGPIVSAGTPGMNLNAPVEVVVPYDPLLAGDQEIGVYRAQAGSWVYVGGVPEAGSSALRTYSWKLGQFQVFAGPHTDMKPDMPFSFNLEQNFPNPFNPSTQVHFTLTRAQHVTVDVYNLMGQCVARLADQMYPAGQHVLTWTPEQLSSGFYFLRLEAQEGTLYRKMMFLK